MSADAGPAPPIPLTGAPNVRNAGLSRSRSKTASSARFRSAAKASPERHCKVQQHGARINLYRFLDFEGGEHLRWKVELKDGKLVGTFSALHDDPKKWVYDRTGALTLTKADPATSK